MKINVRELNDLSLIITEFESRLKPGQAPVRSYRLMDTAEKLNKKNLDLVDLSGVREGVTKFNRDFQESEQAPKINEINKLISDFYSPNKNTTFKTQVGDVGLNIQGTLGKILSSADAGEVAKGIVQDCLPCELRLEGFSLQPATSFLNNIISQLENLINLNISFANNMLNTNLSDVEFCATFDLFDFNCLPDISSIILALKRDIDISYRIPAFKLPSPGDLISLALTPMFSLMSSLAVTYGGLIVNPIDCVVSSIDNQISKITNQINDTKVKIDLKFNLDFGGLQVSGDKGISTAASMFDGKTRQSKDVDIIESYKKQFLNKQIDAKAAIDYLNKTLKPLDDTKKYLVRLKDKLLATKRSVINWLNQYQLRYASISNNLFSSIFNIVNQTIDLISKFVSFSIMVFTYATILERLKGCDKSELANQKESIAKKTFQNFAAANRATADDLDLDNFVYTNTVKLTPKESAVLGLDSLGFDSTEDPTQTSNDDFLLEFKKEFDFNTCKNKVLNNTFYNIDEFLTND